MWTDIIIFYVVTACIASMVVGVLGNLHNTSSDNFNLQGTVYALLMAFFWPLLLTRLLGIELAKAITEITAKK